MKKFFFLPGILLLLFSAGTIAQPSAGGSPYSFHQTVESSIDHLVIQGPDMDLVRVEDANDDKNGTLKKVGRSLFADISPENSGTWTYLSDGSRVWRLKITSPGALALGMYYDRFWLPPGARLFLYTENHDEVLGAYTEDNNSDAGVFVTELTSGETVILEYYEPSRTIGRTVLHINEIAYVYRDYKPRKTTKDFGDSESCEVNINCPEGNSWQDEKKGVARIMVKTGISYGWCSGTLINNQRQDCTPYFLTADHCGEGASTNDLNQWVFYFNYEAAGCTNPSTEPASNSITGCTLKAHGGNGGDSGSDFYLVQLSSTPTFNTYYNGWDRNNTAPAGGVSIHHPSGDIKKISTFTSTATSSSWGGTVPNTHWQLVWAATATNHGVTEGGSSGSPLFNNSGLVVGDLTGGGSYCTSPNAPDQYGKFSYSWDQNGTTPATRLKDWLDPDNTGISTLAGKSCGGSSSIVANFSANSTAIPVGGTVNFTDLSTGAPTSWSWSFTGGTPATSTVQNPTGIQYNTAGIYTVSLTASNGTGSDTETKVNYITVGDPPPVANFTANVTNIPVGGSVNFTDLTAGNPTSWSWTFNGGTPASSTVQNPSGIVYNTAGVYTVSLTATNIGGSDTETKVNYIVVGSGPVDAVCDTLRFPLPGNLVMYSIRYQGGVYGYISGNNGYSDKAKADYFVPASPYVKLMGVYYRFGKAKKLAAHDTKVAFHIWDNSGPGGSPGAVLRTDSVDLGQITLDVAQHKTTFVEFDVPMDVTGPFYAGLDLPMLAGDTLALLTNKNGQSVPNSAWEQWRSGIWYPYSDSSSWRYNLSHAIYPVMCRQDYSTGEISGDDYLIYPNPTQGDLTIVPFKTADEVWVSVFNLMGRLVKESRFENQPSFVMHLGGLQAGIYFVRMESGKSVAVKKISLIK